jgi:uncharacterized membrane protein
VEEQAEDQDGMEQAEHDLLADLRRARRSLRLQDMDEPPAGARLTPGQRIADAVATVMGSWSFIIVQSAILFVWITANLVGATRATAVSFYERILDGGETRSTFQCQNREG